MKPTSISTDRWRFVFVALLVAAVHGDDSASSPGANVIGASKEARGSSSPVTTAHSERRAATEYIGYPPPRFAKDHSFGSDAVLVWGGDDSMASQMRRDASLSNIRRHDYAGAESCRECHEQNHRLWSSHAHRWMNVEAEEESVKGDFSGGLGARISYRGGTGEFYRENSNYMMKLSRDGIERVFRIRRTLGSRVHQYYIGVMEQGPEPDGHAYRSEDHVLPFGFELTMRQWVPLVHATGHQGADSKRDDPFQTPSRLPYDKSCSICHTTPPMGDVMLAMFTRFAAYSPRSIHFEGSNYVDEMHPGAVRIALKPGERLTRQNGLSVANDLILQAEQLLKPDKLASLGISCEACHLGSKAHAQNAATLPRFFPSGPYVSASGSSDEEIWGRSAENKNFTCARCHSGARPQFAAGMATWNSTEYTDATRGSCYDPSQAKAHGMESLTCVDCHNPHETIGRRWTKTSASDSASCVKCHNQYRDDAVVSAHTHHPIGSTGSQCMNCHMPKINEGLGDLVRTHTIFSPTNARMLEANQPNACNMCHVDKAIDWTLKYLGEWYGLTGSADSSSTDAACGSNYSPEQIERNYPFRNEPAAVGWLRSPHSGTRLVGSDVLIKAQAEWVLPYVAHSLDDPHMEIRQFTVQRLRDYFRIDVEAYGYKHYMTAAERKAPLRKLIDHLTRVGQGNQR